MSQREIVLFEYDELELHPVVDAKHGWLLSIKEVCEAFKTDLRTVIDIQEANRDELIEGVHYLFDSFSCCGTLSSQILFWSKKGVLRLAYYLKSEAAMNFLEAIQELKLSSSNGADAALFYDEIERQLAQRLEALKNGEESSLEELNRLIFTVDNLNKKRTQLRDEHKEEGSALDGILRTVERVLQLDPSSIEERVSKLMQDVQKSGNEKRD